LIAAVAIFNRMTVTYFETPAQLRKWFRAHAASADELWVGFYKKDSGKPSITWPESIDEALCVGWIDGIRKRIDDTSYKIRFTPRRKGSIWSAVNIRRVAALSEERRMRPGGLKAFEARIENKSGIYSYEQRRDSLEEPWNTMLRKHTAAWDFFQAQPPSWRKQIGWWIISAKQEETRMKRFESLVKRATAGRREP
jgi:uncharacterized protein YdeI (YjbR/CyaY-like superfamily)